MKRLVRFGRTLSRTRRRRRRRRSELQGGNKSKIYDFNRLRRLIIGSSKRAVTIIAEAQEKSSFRVSELIPEEKNPNWKTSKDGKDESCISDVQNRREGGGGGGGGGGGESGILKLELSSSKKLLTTETTTDSLSLEQVAGGSRSSGSDFSEETVKGGSVYLPFPCPFCDRAYTSWGFRRRHIKAVHTISPSLNCKWCPQVLPTHTAWKQHVIYAHNLSANDAHNGLLILEEAHMVLQIVRPTRLDTLVNIIKQSSQQNDHSQVDKD